jgi:hypothetical protein
MPPESGRISAVLRQCEEWLSAAGLDGFAAMTGRDVGQVWTWLESIGCRNQCDPRLRDWAAAAGVPEALAGRALLALAAPRALEEAPRRGIPAEVIELLCDEFSSFAAAPAAWLADVGFEHVRFREMARIATLHRFPAGQFHWEISGVPRSTFWKAGARGAAALAAAVARSGGFSPMFEFHVNERRRNRSVLLEREAAASYLRMARALALQPRVRGLMSCSWFFCSTITQVTPHLAWLRRQLEQAGARFIPLGPAGQDDGFLKGSPERRAQFEAGRLRPRLVLVIWPRAAVLDWARRQEPARAAQ